MRFLFFILFLSTPNISSQIKEYSCDEFIKPETDFNNLTEEEIIALKSQYFDEVLTLQNQNCISKKLGTSNISGSQTLASSLMKGSDLNIETSSVQSSNNSPSNIPLKENLLLEDSSKNSALLGKNSDLNKNEIITENGAIPECLQSFNNNSELSKLLAEAISEEDDQVRKNELIKRYAQINNLKSEEIKC